MGAHIYPVDKPVGFSSFQIVRVFKRFYRKVGHAGTLDPCASGLLLVLVGDATRKFLQIQEWDKEYCGEIFFGMESDTYDISGRFSTPLDFHNKFTAERLDHIASEFLGEVQQTPPPFSAIKQNGKKLYELSRMGKKVHPKSRAVHIKALSITYYKWPRAEFRTIVGKGTYVRALVHDIGRNLGCGATLLSLRRLRVGKYHVKDALTLGRVYYNLGGG